MEVAMEENGEKKKFNKKLLLLPLLPLLLIPLFAALAAVRFLKGRKDRAAVKALARQLVAERKGGGKSAPKGRKAAAVTSKAPVKGKGKRHVAVVVRQEGESRVSLVSKVRNLFGKRMLKFVMVALAERVIASQRARLKESLPPIPLSGRLSKAKDI